MISMGWGGRGKGKGVPFFCAALWIQRFFVGGGCLFNEFTLEQFALDIAFCWLIGPVIGGDILWVVSTSPSERANECGLTYSTSE